MVTIQGATHNHLSTFEIFSLLIPHGIFEIPALILSSSIGFYSLKMLFTFFRGKEVPLKRELITILNLLIITILLFVAAAIVEANITSVFQSN